MRDQRIDERGEGGEIARDIGDDEALAVGAAVRAGAGEQEPAQETQNSELSTGAMAFGP